jgi:hypothetical protein
MKTFITLLSALFVTAQVLAQSPDAYEPNDDVQSATLLTLNFTNHGNTQTGNLLTFTNDTATVMTVGANIHVNSDVDYYKIELPPNAGSMFMAEIFNRNNNPNVDGNNYSLYPKFSYSLDGGQTWSITTYQRFAWTAIPSNMVYFRVVPNGINDTGTYAIQIDVVADFNEPNNTVETAILLPLPFVNDSAATKVINSLVLSAIDYYKVALPPTAGCMFTAETFNRHNSPNIDGSNYSLYPKFSYSLNRGQTWSGATYQRFGWTSLDADTIYFRIEPNGINDMGSYAIQIGVAADFNEPNNTVETATVLPFVFNTNDSAYVRT